MSLAGVRGLHIDATTDSFIRRSGYSWGQFQASTRDFGDDQFVTVQVASSPPYSQDSLRALQSMSRELEKIAGVTRVDSLDTVPLIRPSVEGGVLVNSALSDGVPRSIGSHRALIDEIRRDRVAPGFLVSRRGDAFAVNVYFDQSIEGEAHRLVHEIGAVSRRYEGIISGVPVFRVAVNERMRRELVAFVPLVVAATAAVLFALLGAMWSVAVAIGVAGLGCVVTLGVMGLAGVPLTLTTMILPCVLLALGCAYSMHPLLAASRARSRGESVKEMERVARPVALSGLTTALGFVSMATVRLPMIQELAIFGALGVLILTAACLALVPALVVVFRRDSRRQSMLDRLVSPVPRFARAAATTHRWWSITLWGVLLFSAGSGVLALEVSTDVVKWFSRGVDVREDYEAIRSTLSGITPINAVVRSDDGQTLLSPLRLAAIDNFRREFEERPEVGRAIAVTDPLREVNEGFTGRAEIPDSELLAEQYLLLLDGVEQVAAIVRADRLATNVVARVDDNGSESLIRVGRWAEDWWIVNGPPGTSLVATGFMLQVARSAEEISVGLAKGLLLALLSVGLVLVLVLGSARSAALALIPNVVPVSVVFGLMGWWGISVDAATIVLGSLALGIAVDDTIHLMLGFERERMAGASVEGTIEKCVADIGPALTATTLAVCAGFGVLGLSEFRPVSNLGVLTVGLIGLCLAADLVLLPSLLKRRATPAVSN